MKSYSLKVSGSFDILVQAHRQTIKASHLPSKQWRTMKIKVKCLLLLVGLLLLRGVKCLEYLLSWLDCLVRRNLKFRITIVCCLFCFSHNLCLAVLVFMYHYKDKRDCYSFSCCLHNLQILVSFNSANSHKSSGATVERKEGKRV